MTTPSVVKQYPYYSLIRVIATFVSTDLTTLADPSTVTFYVANPLGTVASYVYLASGASIVRDATGCYWREDTADIDGEWRYFARGTGGVQASEEWRFNVRRSLFNL